MTDDKSPPPGDDFAGWLRAEALAPPPAPRDEWGQIQARLAAEPQAQSAPLAQRESANLWSLTWPSLIAAAIPLAFVLWSGSAELVSPFLSLSGDNGALSSSFEAAADDDQLWLSAGDSQLDVLASSDPEPLFVD